LFTLTHSWPPRVAVLHYDQRLRGTAATAALSSAALASRVCAHRFPVALELPMYCLSLSPAVRGSVAGGIVGLAAGSIGWAAAPGADYPTRSIRMIVPFAAGGATDILARIVGQRLTELWGQTVVIDNRAGAGGTVGAAIAARANADGYTLVMGTNGSHAIGPSLYSKLTYDAIKDFAPITLVAHVPQALMVHPSLPVKDVRELIAYAKQRPGELNYSSAGTGTPGHLGLELMQLITGTKMVHVPFAGGAPGLAALVGGQVQLMADNMNSALPMIKSGKVRAIAVTTIKRSVALPDLATVAEQGLPGFDSGSWFGLFAPAGTPQVIIARLNTEVVKILNTPEVRERMLQQGAEPAPGTPAQFTQLIRDDTVRWAKVIKASGAKAD